MPGAAVKLFCFAHAGGGAWVFAPWRAALAPDIEVCPVVLPGRESRRWEAPYVRMEQFIGPLTEAVAERADRPFAFFGHSLGAIIAYEVARGLSPPAAAMFRCLLVSGRRAPHLPGRRPPVHHLTDAGFADMLREFGGTPEEVLGDADLLGLFLPALRADFELNDSYAPLPGGRLACPVSAFLGDGDPETSVAEMAGWATVSAGPFRLRQFSGAHFYLIERRRELLAVIRAELMAGAFCSTLSTESEAGRISLA